jgi:membrane-associated phospholipid phosphatase
LAFHLPNDAVIDASRLRVSEALALIYFAYLSVAALARPLPAVRRVRVWLATAALVAAYVAILSVPQADAVSRVRDWLPAPVILLAYFVTGAFFVAPSARAEAWLRRLDDRWLGRSRLGRVPRGVVVYLDVMYDACFLMIPAGCAVLALSGRSALADRYWTLVSAAEFGAFATLPWLQARPPWAIEPPRAIDHTAVRRFSLFWVNHTSIRATTFPSGHVSGSLAAALALIGPMPVAGAVFLALAVSISIACVVGRYHYIVDVLAGAALAIVVWMAAAWYLAGSHG